MVVKYIQQHTIAGELILHATEREEKQITKVPLSNISRSIYHITEDLYNIKKITGKEFGQ